MSKRTITLILVGYLITIWAAVIFRIDYFPLTWVPMYSVYEPRETIAVKVWDKDKYRKGLKVTHRDRSTSYVSYKDLNIPQPNFRRLYYSRIFGTAPRNTSKATRNWGRSTDGSADWRKMSHVLRLIGSGGCFGLSTKPYGMNHRTPNLSFEWRPIHQKRVYRKEDLLRQDVRQVQIDTRQALIEWREEWLPRWEHGIL